MIGALMHLRGNHVDALPEPGRANHKEVVSSLRLIWVQKARAILGLEELGFRRAIDAAAP